LQQASGTALGADVSVLKRVPWGAGLGGGSSDAASTLLALNRLWCLDWPRDRLQALALPLGADVPFFVGGHNAFVEGIGERLTALSALGPLLAEQRYAVVKPGPAIATEAIFGSPLLVRNTEPAIVTGLLAGAEFGDQLVSGYGRNDLQLPAQASCPEVAQVAAWLERRLGNSRMSGSGSAVFSRIVKSSLAELALAKDSSVLQGAIDQPSAPGLAADPVEDLPPGWLGRVCQGLDHHPLLGWAD
jgi:4-diphosphocytidyl-2-C-methyl-D-erythritol kinase